MAHYKETEKGQGLFLTVNLSEQLVPGTFEHTLNRLIDKKLDLSIGDNAVYVKDTEKSKHTMDIILRSVQHREI